jgi:putative inorganic carbon (HCO3(-)) transporter
MDKGISSKEIFNNLGIIYYEGGNFEKAVEIFDKGLKFSREFPEILYNMGLALYKKGEIEKAFESWERVLEIDPEFIEAQEAIQKYREGK